MEKRTMDRKRYDLQLLHDMLKEDPTNPRHYYYLAQTYNLLEDYEQAAYWFKRRASTALKGHDQEAVDSWFELARTYNFKLNRPWEECKHAYEEAYKMDPSRPEALYFIGIHYYLEGDRATAFKYFKDAFALGYPIHAQFSLKPTLVFHFLPKFLAELAYQFEDWQQGMDACMRFLTNNKEDADQYEVMQNWYNIFEGLLQYAASSMIPKPMTPPKPFLAFVADGGWGPWSGSDILTKGVGGSETYIIELARWIQAARDFQVVVFCRCHENENFEGVNYQPIENYPRFIANNVVHTAVISRYTQYIPMSIYGNVENVYLVLHDLFPAGTIIPLHPKLKKVLCLTKWHEQYFLERFPQFKGRTDAFYYGIDAARFKPSLKVKNSFIYSSFPNRGLLPLLQMWPRIKQAIPDATLHVYSDIEGKWVNRVAKDQMDEIRRLLSTNLEGVTMHGWVSKGELAEAWSKADIWFYPCIFQETFCLTALEAAASKTLAIAPPLAALQETVGNRGILLPGNPMDAVWQTSALESILAVLRDPKRKADLLEQNYQWATSIPWSQRGKEFAAKYLLPALTTKQAPSSLASAPAPTPTINTLGVENWTHDQPTGHKKFVEEALRVANPTRILEIGAHAGVSLIDMLQRYPSATAIAIDTWDAYEEPDTMIAPFAQNKETNRVEAAFYQNIKVAAMEHRIQARKGDSTKQLSELLTKGERFDFIYLDASHMCLDVYADMVLSWNLLTTGGVLAVNDVMYHADEVMEGNVLPYPLVAKQHFMKKYVKQYDVVSDSYRLFLKKK
jgi:predicted O-methyltransferase YrrM/tetratricopeptide (TPR) repeat protein